MFLYDGDSTVCLSKTAPKRGRKPQLVNDAATTHGRMGGFIALKRCDVYCMFLLSNKNRYKSVGMTIRVSQRQVPHVYAVLTRILAHHRRHENTREEGGVEEFKGLRFRDTRWPIHP